MTAADRVALIAYRVALIADCVALIADRVESWTIRDGDGNAYTNPVVIRLERDTWYERVYAGK